LCTFIAHLLVHYTILPPHLPSFPTRRSSDLFHYTVFGTVVFSVFAGTYFWFPKMTGRMLNERLGKWHFWLTFIGFHTTFLVQHWLGNQGMARRYADYLDADGFTVLNQISSLGALTLGISMLP